MFSWGCGEYGLLGNGSHDQIITPTNISATSILASEKVVKVEGGESNAIALTEDGKIYTWGSNWFGMLGNGTTSSDPELPVAVDMTGALAGKTVVDVAVGAYSAYALTSDGQVYSWGANWGGMLGDGTTTDRHVPTTVDFSGALAGKQVVDMAVGEYSVNVLTSDGGLYGWGANYSGKVGNGTTDQTLSPAAVDTSGVLAGKSIKDINMKSSATVALDEAGQVYVWGGGFKIGAIGDDTLQQVTVPTITSSFTPHNTELPVVKFDGVVATDVRFEDNGTNFKKLVAVAPPHAAGTVDVSVKFDGHPEQVFASSYTYIAPPTKTSLKLNTFANSHSTAIAPALSRGEFKVTGGCAEVDSESLSLLGAESIEAPLGVDIYGGVAFSLKCINAGDKSDVAVTLDSPMIGSARITDKNIDLLRAYKTFEGKLVDISSQVNFSIVGNGDVAVSYSLVDGGDLDEDGVVNGEIIDPIYIGVAASSDSLADTGASSWLLLTVALLTIGTGVVVLVRVRRRYS